VKAAAIVFAAAAAFFGAVQFGGLHLGSRPHEPRPVELTRIVASETGRPAATPIHSEIPQHVESGRVLDHRKAGRPR
jgi:hypothetical protein